MKAKSSFCSLVAWVWFTGGLCAGEIWVEQSLSGPPMGSGTRTSPYRVPVGDSTAFDLILSTQSENTAVHLGAGTFLTQGSNGVRLVRLADGGALYGSGMGITIIKLADNAWPGGPGAVVRVNSSGPAAGFQGTVRDLTVDANFANQPGADYSDGVTGVGHSFLVENVEIINLGSREGEGFGVFIGNMAEADVPETSHVILRNLKVHKPWSGTDAGLCGLCPTGNNAWGGVVEGCYVDLSDAPDALSAAYAFAGSPQGLVIAHNTAIGADDGVHVDTPGAFSPIAARNVIIRDNRFYNCMESISIGPEDDIPMSGRFENFSIESNAIEMLGANNRGIALWGSTRGFQVKNNTILKNPNAPGSIYRVGIYVSSGAEGHVVTGNRFGPSGDPYFDDINPIYYTDTAAKKNRFEDNTWTGDGVLAKTITSVRQTGVGITPPAGSNLWTFGLGSGHSDFNPTTVLSSSDLNGANGYDYLWLSRSAGGVTTGYNTILDPQGTSGVYVGDSDSGNLAVGGWMVAKTGLIMESGARLYVAEGGSAARMGAVTLVAGQATVSTTSVNAGSRIFLTPQQDGGTPGAVRVSSRVAGSSFVIKSTSATDASIVGWLIIDH